MNKKTLTGPTRRLVMTAMLSAASVVLAYINFPLPFLAPPFIKFDLSDLPALVAAFSMGSVPGIAVCFIKNLIHLTGTMTGGVGELSNFLLSAIFVTVASRIYRIKKNRRSALIGSLLGALAMAGGSIATNYFVVYPFYYNIMSEEAVLGAYQAIFPFVDSILDGLLISNFPFTFLKGVASTAVCFLIYKQISPFIKGAETSRITHKTEPTDTPPTPPAAR